jgi:hypothetical protein
MQVCLLPTRFSVQSDADSCSIMTTKQPIIRRSGNACCLPPLSATSTKHPSRFGPAPRLLLVLLKHGIYKSCKQLKCLHHQPTTTVLINKSRILFGKTDSLADDRRPHIGSSVSQCTHPHFQASCRKPTASGSCFQIIPKHLANEHAVLHSGCISQDFGCIAPTPVAHQGSSRQSFFGVVFNLGCTIYSVSCSVFPIPDKRHQGSKI